MAPRLKIATIAAVLLVGITVYCVVPREPRYQGRTASEWLACIDSLEGRNALSHIGPAALPCIIKELQAKDPPWKLTLVQWAKQLNLFQIQLTPDTMRRHPAVVACRALGPAGKPAIPALGIALGYGTGEALSVLESFGPETIPVLARALTNAPSCGVPYGTALALKNFGAKARAAVPELIWTFENHALAFPRSACAHALAAVYCDLTTNGLAGDEARLAKAALLRGLHNPKLFAQATFGLGKMGPLAIDAVPLIAAKLESLPPMEKDAALRALQSIAPDWAAHVTNSFGLAERSRTNH